MTEDKKLRIEFAPGAFDHFDGTQEELDELIKELEQMFEGKTPEELEALGTELSEEDFEELPEDVKRQIVMSMEDFDELQEDYKRKLQ